MKGIHNISTHTDLKRQGTGQSDWTHTPERDEGSREGYDPRG